MTATTAPLLDVNDLSVSYGAIRAVRNLHLHVHAGETVALIGANGAGKTSTLSALARMQRNVQGQVFYAGRDLMSLPAHALVSAGLALVPEGRGVFPRLSVLENLAMGAYSRRVASEVAADQAEMFEWFPRLKERAYQAAGTLSGGEQQMLAIARALMSRPGLLLLDEPSMGLSPVMVQKIFAVIRQIAARGVSVLLVEQNAKLALEVSERAYVMESGAISLEGPSDVLLSHPGIRAAYLGE